MKIVNNPFVLRQTKESPFSYFAGNIEEVPKMVMNFWSNQEPGYRDGVISVTINHEGFFSGVVSLESGAELTGAYTSRREGEVPRKQVLAKGARKVPAKRVEVILYRSDVLAEGGDNSLEPDKSHWEVVSINASPIEGDVPMDPETLMHNHFGSDGGTETNLSDAEFLKLLREGFDFWKDKVMAG
jgi:hypothetical protein